LWASRRERIAAARFLVDQWPREVRDCVRPLLSSQWNLLQFANRGGEAAVQLLASNMALAYLLAATHGCDDDLPELLTRRRRELAALAGFPCSERSVRLLQKVPAACVTEELLSELRGAGGDEELAAWLSHLPRINPVVLLIGRDERLRSRFSPACIRRLVR